MSQFVSQETVGIASASTPPLPALPAEVRSESAAYASHAAWGMSQRHLEAGETHRLNADHWRHATDCEINEWLREHLPTVRARTAYETRNNPMLAGVRKTVVDDVIGPDGPMLEVQSDDDAYNRALEEIWRDWFRAPTFRPHFSGASLLKLWIKTLINAGEFLATIANDDRAEGPVKLRLRPTHPRRLGSPFNRLGNPRHIMGIDFDDDERPARYWIADRFAPSQFTPHHPDDVIHEFVVEEEGQARGYPWLAASLPASADLRDFDGEILDAARSMADTSGLLWTNHQDAPVWMMPETTKVERRTYKMAPPGWQPWNYPGTAPPAQYPDYRNERHRELGRPINMPSLIVRYDASRHNYSSARFDSQGWNGTVDGFQCWLSGTPESAGTLNRLVDLVAREARFSISALRRRPRDLAYIWTFTPRGHVDPTKEADAETIGLETGTTNLIDVLAARGTTLARHLRSLERIRRDFEAAGIPLPAWFPGQQAATDPGARAATAEARERRAARDAREQEPASAD